MDWMLRIGSLAVEEPNEAVLSWADENDLTLHHLGLQEGATPWDALRIDCIADALQVRLRVRF
jgi:tyrosine-protein phosphatase OCA1